MKTGQNVEGALLSRLWAAIAMLLVAGAALQAQDQPNGDYKGDYKIGPQDVIAVTVYNQAEMSGNYTVEADGTLGFPLIGRVQAGGLTLRAFEAALKAKLADGYFRNPQVRVAIGQYRSQRIFVTGEVRQPGTYPLTGDMTLIEALARAGSTTPTASGEAIIVRSPAANGPTLPGQDDQAETTRVDLNALQRGAIAQNVGLRDGDTVYLPRADTVYVFGQVKNPGAYSIQKDTTVLQALSLAGGLTEYGAMGRIKIVRLINGDKREIKVKLNDLVRPGDTVVVPERWF